VRRLRRNAKRAAIAIVGVAALATLVVVSGVVPIGASAGHWRATEIALHFAMRRSVALYSRGAPEAPLLDDPRLIRIGAGHYEGGCRFCHGSPGREMPEVARHMTPSPPWLPDGNDTYDDRELFTIVRHGVKLTGMPAWPVADRDDEIWAVVAFLRELPRIDRAGYDRWVRPAAPADGPEVVRRDCARCHGVDGRDEAFPRLAGQRAAYLLASLEAYARGTRPSGIMKPIAVALDGAAMREAVAWYASLEAPTIRVPDGSRGAQIAEHGLVDREVPACAHCHGPGREPHHPAYPDLAGQPVLYLEDQLRLFVRGVRGGSPYREIMREVVVHALRPDEITEVARFYGEPR
jgi:cytochrome c553